MDLDGKNPSYYAASTVTDKESWTQQVFNIQNWD